MAKLNEKDIRVRSEPAPQALADRELDQVAGGRKAGEGQKDFLVIKLKEVFVANV